MRRTIQISLGLIWLLDGALLQSFMYGGGFIAALKATGAGQPPWVADTVNWAANIMQSHQARSTRYSRCCRSGSGSAC